MNALRRVIRTVGVALLPGVVIALFAFTVAVNK